jgi:ADP-heptose:LPS heptosyltransferase
MRFNIGHYRVEHINKHRKGRRLITSPTKKQLVQQPTSFQNYIDVFEKLGFPVNVQFTSIFPEGGGDLSQLPESMRTKRATEQWIGIAPFAAHEGKVYPPQLMEQVIKQLTELHPDARILLFGRGERENQLFTKWCQQYQQCVFVSQHLKNIQQELILMSHLDVMLSMDSANMHMASLVATPVVSVWGATHPYAGFMGWGQNSENVIQADLDCRPCSIYGQKPCKRGDYACLNMIKPETIVEKINTLLQTKQNN